MAWMDALVPRFSLPTTVRTESRPRRISQHTDYAREAEATGLLVQVECHVEQIISYTPPLRYSAKATTSRAREGDRQRATTRVAPTMDGLG